MTEQLTTDQMRHLGATNPMGRLVSPDGGRTTAFLAAGLGFTTGHLPVRRRLAWLKPAPPPESSDLGKGFSHAHHRPSYAGYGIHELVAHVANQGYYEDEGVPSPSRRGHWKTERLRVRRDDRSGPTLLSRLTDGIDWKVLSVNTHRPPFWLLGSADVTSMADSRAPPGSPRRPPPPLFRPDPAQARPDPTAAWNVVYSIRVNTRWTCDAFETASLTAPT